MFPFHTVAEMQFYSSLGHWIEGGILGIVAIIALLEALGYLRFKARKYLWPGLVLFAGIFLWMMIFFLQPFYHGWGNAIPIWRFILNDPQQRQHLIMGTLLALGGWAEIKYRQNPVTHDFLKNAWAIVLAAIGLMFILHPQHGTGEAIAKAHMFHQYLGTTLILAGVLKKASLESKRQWLAFIWLLPLAISAVMLMTYHEPEGAYEHGVNQEKNLQMMH